MTSIESAPPADWQGLQAAVFRILTECGMRAQVEHSLSNVRGQKKIDVFAEDSVPIPSATYLCECKHWAGAIPQDVIHGFRTVVADSGANLGMIIAKTGFQPGAQSAVAFTNIKLLTWGEFQELFARRWFETYMLPELLREVEPLHEYTEPLNSRISRRAGGLSTKAQQRFPALQRKWFACAFLPSRWQGINSITMPTLPLRSSELNLTLTQGIPEDILDAVSLRDLLDSLIRAFRTATQEFDDMFEGRA